MQLVCSTPTAFYPQFKCYQELTYFRCSLIHYALLDIAGIIHLHIVAQMLCKYLLRSAVEHRTWINPGGGDRLVRSAAIYAVT